ncbi:helix-turn-helix domain-containing protein [Nocardiopsis mangrovi]|uniref:Helix-turn-helix domain-containing protein n=1 Tax=Nocardiopsis mangrovi TaxID=1179818 RepID=A0ABV9E247_9ACTN
MIETASPTADPQAADRSARRKRRAGTGSHPADDAYVVSAARAPGWRCVRALGDVRVWAVSPAPPEDTGTSSPVRDSGPGELFISLPPDAATPGARPGPETATAPETADGPETAGGIDLYDAPYPFPHASGTPGRGSAAGLHSEGGAVAAFGDGGAFGTPGDGGVLGGAGGDAGSGIARDGAASGAAAVGVPRAALLLPAPWVDGLLGRRIPVADPVGVLLAGLVQRVASDAAGFGAAADERLGGAVLDLAAALLARELDLDAPEESHRRNLILRIQAFVNRHLGDPLLSPGMIAEAHGISVGYLHRLLQGHDTTLAAWIRRRRLDGARRALSDPRLARLRVQEIGTRWGFPHPSAFSRAFRTAYGTTPKDYREAAARPADPVPPAG